MQAALLATRLAQLMDMSTTDVCDVYYTTLLRSASCTAYAHEEAVLLDDAELARAGSVDWADPREVLRFWLHHVARDSSPLEHARIIAENMPRWFLVRHEQITAHCEVDAPMVRRLDLAPVVQQALQQVFERWDGRSGGQSCPEFGADAACQLGALLARAFFHAHAPRVSVDSSSMPFV